MKKLILLAISAALSLLSYGADPTLTPKDGYPEFALGADVSWTPYIETNHLHTYYKGYDAVPDQVTNIPAMVSDHGIDAIRLRVWVNPKGEKVMAGFTFKADGYTYEEMSTFGTCSPDEMAELAHRFASQGQRIMVVFQMSDTWTDPGRQFIPEAWSGCTSVDQLSEKASAHVREVLTMLHDANVNVAWVQIGNEVNNGMLRWNLPANISTVSTVSNVSWGCTISQNETMTKNFVKVFGDAANVAREIYPKTKIVLHLANTTEWSHVNWTMNLLKRAGLNAAMCDYVGLSLYPGVDDGQEDYTAKWKTYADLAIKTIGNLYTTYGYRSMICEMGLNNEYSKSTNMTNVSKADEQRANIEQCNADVRAFTQYLIDNLDTETSTCDGLFYWEPETDYMKGYKKGACVSITPGPSWPRDKVTANDWWLVVKDHSSFPAGGLVEYRVSEDVEPGFVPDPSLKLFVYHYDNGDYYTEMNTSDGLLYTLTGYAAPQWFNFKVVSQDWTVDLGNAEIGLNQIGFLNNKNDWNAWTSTAVLDTYTWWYRHDTHAMTLTSTADCPWPELGITSVLNDADATPEYYTLQGIRINHPVPGQIYILKKGSLTVKGKR